VTVVYRGDTILRGFDDDVRAHLTTELEKRGIRIITKHIVEAVEKVDHGLCVELSDHDAIVVDQVMFATGRKPDVAGLWDQDIGIELAKHGGIAVDNFSQTSVASIYAIGDVTNRVNLTPVAIREGHAFADTLFGGRPAAVDHNNVPTAVFTEPEVGVIGLTEAQACAKLVKVDIYKASFRPMKATLAGRDTRTFMKLVVDGASDRVVGCHIVGPDAGEMIQLVGIAVKMKATKADFDAVMAVHPTAAEELVTMREKALSHVRQAAE
jgi:glutathione reductase (NADPH)